MVSDDVHRPSRQGCPQVAPPPVPAVCATRDPLPTGVLHALHTRHGRHRHPALHGRHGCREVSGEEKYVALRNLGSRFEGTV